MLASHLFSRKFILTLMLTISTMVGLFTGHLTGGEYLMGVTSLLGVYAISNVKAKKAGEE